MYMLRVCGMCVLCVVCVVICCVGAGVGVQCVVRGVRGVCFLWCVWCVVWCGWACGKPSVCRFKTPPCVRSRRLRVYHVLNMRTFSGYTRRRPERTHGGVLNLHTEGFSAFSSLFSSLLSFSLSLHSLSLAIFPLLSSLFSLSATMSMITHPVRSLWVHTALTSLSACTLAHSLSDEHVRIMHETTVLVLLCKPRATWNEVGLYLCWKWVLCLVVFRCVSMW